MNSKECILVIGIVERINEELYEKFRLFNEECPSDDQLIYCTMDGYSHWIKFKDKEVWNSENDERSFIEDDYEDLEKFIRKRLNYIFFKYQGVSVKEHREKE
jgi:hypothetical protein